jgi:hypothetical protein
MQPLRAYQLLERLLRLSNGRKSIDSIQREKEYVAEEDSH